MSERENERVIMNVKNAGKMMKSILWFNSPLLMGSVLLTATFLRRMLKEKKLRPGQVYDFEKFVKKTEGNYEIMNIPSAVMADEKTIRDHLDVSGITYHILPDLDRNDGMLQVAIKGDDSGKFMSVYERAIKQKLQGGEHWIEDMDALTDGKYNIVSLPTENAQEIAGLKKDFNSLQINYAVLPDLKVGDGETQLLVANADIAKLKHWYTLYKNDKLANGEELKDLKIVENEQYYNTGKMEAEEYVGTADEEMQKANDKYEGREPGKVELMAQLTEVRSTDNAAFHKFDKNSEYVKVSINHEALVEKATFAQSVKANNSGYFASRIPGIWGDTEKTLVLPMEQVFVADNGQTYLAFVHKSDKPIILDSEGKKIGDETRMSGVEIKNYYDDVKRGPHNVKKLDKENVLENTSKKKAAKTKNNNNFDRRAYDMDSLEAQLLAEPVIKKVPDRIPQNPIKIK